jgi:hypothetical protein
MAEVLEGIRPGSVTANEISYVHGKGAGCVGGSRLGLKVMKLSEMDESVYREGTDASAISAV